MSRKLALNSCIWISVVFDVLVISLSHECCFNPQKQKISRTKYLTFCQAQESHLYLTLLTTKSKEIFQLQSLCFHQSRPRSSVYWTRQPLLCHWSVPPLYTHTHHPPELFHTGHHHCVCCCGLCCTCSISILYCIISSALQCSVCPSQLHSDWCNVVVLLELYCTVTFHSSISIYALQI